jgi:hypothetical protein
MAGPARKARRHDDAVDVRERFYIYKIFEYIAFPQRAVDQLDSVQAD